MYEQVGHEDWSPGRVCFLRGMQGLGYFSLHHSPPPPILRHYMQQSLRGICHITESFTFSAHCFQCRFNILLYFFQLHFPSFSFHSIFLISINNVPSSALPKSFIVDLFPHTAHHQMFSLGLYPECSHTLTDGGRAIVLHATRSNMCLFSVWTRAVWRHCAWTHQWMTTR